MSEYKQYMEEKRKIDELISLGYLISSVTENLEGAFVDFILARESPRVQEKNKQLHVLTAEGRKYFSNLIIAQQRQIPLIPEK